MKCPKCQGEMETVVHEEIEVDRCTNCNGLWFDASEKDALLKIQGAEDLDTGSGDSDQSRNLALDIMCPRCDVKMIHMVDDQQIHIHFESCPKCEGQFFDAGEFRDLKDVTIVESFAAKLRAFKKANFSGR